MLFKNDEIQKLIPNSPEVKAIEKFFHNKFPVKVVYPPDRIVPNPLPHNRLPDKPNSMSFDLLATVKTPSGAETWRYAENVIIEPSGRKKYVPKKFKFAGTRWLDRNDIELIYFLLKKSPYCLGGDNQGRRVKFMFEDLVTAAEKKAEKRAMETKIGNMLYGDYALPDAKIVEVAKGYHIDNADSYTIAQLKGFIESKISSSKTGMDDFFEMVGDEEMLKVRNNLQKVVDMKVLDYDLGKKKWYWKSKTGKEEVKGGSVPPTLSPMDTLYNLYIGNERFKEDIQAVLISKKPHTGKVLAGATVGDEDEKNE